MKKIIIIGVIVFVSCALSVGELCAAPCYGTTMPEKHQFVLGAQTYMIFDRDLEKELGSMRSTQHFFLLTYGLTKWCSIDLKIGLGNIKQHPNGVEEIDYPSSFAGGYGFRLTLYEHDRLKVVGGFQHISVHPHTTRVNVVKHTAILDDWQGSVLVSYSFTHLTPYLGAILTRMDYIHWQSGERKRTMSDLTEAVAVVAGVDIPLSERVWINIELHTVAIDAVAAAILVRF